MSQALRSAEGNSRDVLLLVTRQPAKPVSTFGSRNSGAGCQGNPILAEEHHGHSVSAPSFEQANGGSAQKRPDTTPWLYTQWLGDLAPRSCNELTTHHSLKLHLGQPLTGIRCMCCRLHCFCTFSLRVFRVGTRRAHRITVFWRHMVIIDKIAQQLLSVVL